MVSHAGMNYLQGDTLAINFTIYNNGSHLYNNLDVVVTIDTNIFEVVDLNGYMPLFANSNKFTRVLNTLNPLQSKHQNTPIITTKKIGQQYLDTTTIAFWVDTIGGDMNPSNNWRSMPIYVVAAIDPNDKSVWPSGNIVDSSVIELTYTIRFQNTGNFAANTVRVVDTLPAYFKKENVEIITTSHLAYTSIDSNNVATFIFYNIQLPDSASNPEASKGFINYTIKLDQPMLVGDSIANRAHIFFDNQPPIITNYAWTKIVKPATFGFEAFQNLSFNVFPNPANDVVKIVLKNVGSYVLTLSEISGKELLKTDVEGNQKEIDISPLSSGMYLIKINSKSGNSSGVEKISVLH